MTLHSTTAGQLLSINFPSTCQSGDTDYYLLKEMSWQIPGKLAQEPGRQAIAVL